VSRVTPRARSAGHMLAYHWPAQKRKWIIRAELWCRARQDAQATDAFLCSRCKGITERARFDGAFGARGARVGQHGHTTICSSFVVIGSQIGQRTASSSAVIVRRDESLVDDVP